MKRSEFKKQWKAKAYLSYSEKVIAMPRDSCSFGSAALKEDESGSTGWTLDVRPPELVL